MSISINKEHIQKMAEELGFEVEFNSEKPGVLDTETGIVHSFMDYLSEYLEFDEVENFVTIEELPEVHVLKPVPMKISMRTTSFSFSLEYGAAS